VAHSLVATGFLSQAWRGFCTQVWGRVSRQLHPWELESREDPGIKQVDPRRRSVDLEGGGWVDPWANNLANLTSPAEKGSTEMERDVERVSWMPTFGGPGPDVPDHQGEDPLDPLSARSGSSSALQSSPDQTLSTHSWREPAPRLAMGYSVGDMSDISPWDEPPGHTKSNSNTHLIFPVSEKEENVGESSSTATTTAVQRRRSAGMQQSTLLRRLLRENKRDEVVSPKPPVFGDEIVIVDKRVIRLHGQVVRDILVVGAIWGLVWIAICLAIPTR
jgi:hypothetical protein